MRGGDSQVPPHTKCVAEATADHSRGEALKGDGFRVVILCKGSEECSKVH